jgi:hypothetical protein
VLTPTQKNCLEQFLVVRQQCPERRRVAKAARALRDVAERQGGPDMSSSATGRYLEYRSINASICSMAWSEASMIWKPAQ